MTKTYCGEGEEGGGREGMQGTEGGEDGGGGGSYTIKTEFNKNTLFHGPLFLPWKFVLIKKN